jgi:hypothetical protein
LDVQLGALQRRSGEKAWGVKEGEIRRLAVLFAGFTVCLCGQTLRKVAVIDLGPKGQRLDYLTMDNEDGYWLSAHLTPDILCDQC